VGRDDLVRRRTGSGAVSGGAVSDHPQAVSRDVNAIAAVIEDRSVGARSVGRLRQAARMLVEQHAELERLRAQVGAGPGPGRCRGCEEPLPPQRQGRPRAWCEREDCQRRRKSGAKSKMAS
jgi:hypothetical protein